MILSDEKIVFVLPSSGTRPAGGFKVVYDYASKMANDGYNVSIAHCVAPSYSSNTQKVIMYAKYLLRLAFFKPGPFEWYDLSPKLNLIWLPWLVGQKFTNYGSIILTSWETAYLLGGLRQSSNKNIIYFIQGHETWSTSRDNLIYTYGMNLSNIVISEELKEILSSLSITSTKVPNFAEDAFFIEIPFKSRQPRSFLFNWHQQPSKKSEEVISALRKLKELYPDIVVEAFGVGKRVQKDWIAYTDSPSRAELRKLYNRSKIFISASESEGWGLTPFEAMQCGCVPIASDIGGHREFVIHNVNGFLFRREEPCSLFKILVHAVEKENILDYLHEETKKVSTEFSFSDSYARFMDVIGRG